MTDAVLADQLAGRLPDLLAPVLGPGVREVRARFFDLASALSIELLPTLERPASATSRRSHRG